VRQRVYDVGRQCKSRLHRRDVRICLRSGLSCVRRALCRGFERYRVRRIVYRVQRTERRLRHVHLGDVWCVVRRGLSPMRFGSGCGVR
jgi:hypothetical protein